MPKNTPRVIWENTQWGSKKYSDSMTGTLPTAQQSLVSGRALLLAPETTPASLSLLIGETTQAVRVVGVLQIRRGHADLLMKMPQIGGLSITADQGLYGE